jgi:hypothetical protein
MRSVAALPAGANPRPMRAMLKCAEIFVAAWTCFLVSLTLPRLWCPLAGIGR